MADGMPAEAELDALHDATQRLMSAETEQEICEIAVTSIPDIFGRPIGGLWLYDADATELQLTAATDRADDLFDGSVIYRPGNSLSWEAFEEGEVRTYSMAADSESLYNPDSNVKSEIVLPLGEHGVINIGSLDPDGFHETDIEVAQLLATTVEAALTKTEREHALRVKNDRLEEFISIISHDLRNPLNVAIGYLDQALTEVDNPFLDKVVDALDRMETLIDDLLTLAEQGYVVENRTSIDLEELAEQAWSNVHTPEATLEVRDSVSIFGDKRRLLQVFENLFRNAIEHGREDVTIEVGPVEKMHTSTRISRSEYTDGFYVEDDGPGIPDDEKSDVFDSGHSTNGTGLGLAIVQRIVAAHGWEIDVKDAMNGGARFEITDGTKPVIPFKTF